MNYIKFAGNINITLKRPEDLIFASLDRVKITNMNECVNLANIYSEENTYTKQDIETLRNIKRVHSEDDKYENDGSCLL